MKPKEEIADDFDSIAFALEDVAMRGHLTRPARSLLRKIPRGVRSVLEVGCGRGIAARALGRRGLHVTAVDLSPNLIAIARELTPPDVDVTYEVADLMEDSLPVGPFDLVLCVNTIHHVPLEEGLARLVSRLCPGGTLLLQDVVSRRRGVRHVLRNVVGSLRRFRRPSEESEVSIEEMVRLYEVHGETQEYLTPSEAEDTYASLLPRARVTHHAEGCYSVIWTRPIES